jgi:predicted small lipoprotein YifL
MSRTLRFVTCLIGLSILAGCTIAEPVYKPDLGGYAMIDEKDEKTVVSRHSLEAPQPFKG